jgi:D-alanine-D-alanine ligase
VLGGGKERRLDLDAIVNCCHGGPGEDGTLQAALDMAGMPYTGPAAAGAALCMDKLGFGSVAMAAGLPTLPRTLVIPGSQAPSWEGPYIVKPRFGGSSIGIEVIGEWADVLRYVELGGPHTLQGVVAEPFHADADDVQVSVRSYPVLALSLFERPLRSGGPSPIAPHASCRRSSRRSRRRSCAKRPRRSPPWPAPVACGGWTSWWNRIVGAGG